MDRTLYDKLWDSHVVHQEEDGTALIYIDRHLVHEVTSPQALPKGVFFAPYHFAELELNRIYTGQPAIAVELVK